MIRCIIWEYPILVVWCPYSSSSLALKVRLVICNRMLRIYSQAWQRFRMHHRTIPILLNRDSKISSSHEIALWYSSFLFPDEISCIHANEAMVIKICYVESMCIHWQLWCVFSVCRIVSLGDRARVLKSSFTSWILLLEAVLRGLSRQMSVNVSHQWWLYFIAQPNESAFIFTTLCPAL